MRGAVTGAPVKGQLLTELVKRVRANPAAVAQLDLQEHVKAMFVEDDEVVRLAAKPLVVLCCERHLNPHQHIDHT